LQQQFGAFGLTYRMISLAVVSSTSEPRATRHPVTVLYTKVCAASHFRGSD
jgi:hypothetical protein